MKKGFTIIELLVASLLLSMLVSILTMMFNQSSIAWRTGTAGVIDMNKTRAGLGTFDDIRDELLPGLGDRNVNGGASDNRTIQYRTVSLWDRNAANTLRTSSQRAFNYNNSIVWGEAPEITMQKAMTASEQDIREGKRIQADSPYSVGVRSWGPDGEKDTEDDITTWPEMID